MTRLEYWGCLWSPQDDGHVVVPQFRRMKNERIWFATDKADFHSHLAFS